MASSSWTTINPKIKHSTLKKAAFGKYLYKLRICVPCARAIKSTLSTAEYIEFRKRTVDSYAASYSPSYMVNWLASKINDANAGQIDNLKSAITTIKKYRIEDSILTVYADNEEELLAFANLIDPEYRNQINEIASPASDSAKLLLSEGKIIVSNSHGYKYKVLFKDGRYETDTLKQISDYLSETKQAKVSHGITKPREGRLYIYSQYCFVNDLSCLTFVELIRPGTVGKIYELAVVE